MKTRPLPRGLHRLTHHAAQTLRSSCSVGVLAALGVLAWTLPGAAAAQAGGVTLPATALPVLRGVVSGRAVVMAPVTQGGTRTLTIDQADQRVIVDWRSFNIGRNAEVLFRQPGQTASALNRIYDAAPSVIQGRLGSTGPVVDGKATPGGQIILINQNGILFDRGTQVNVQSLVASTLNLDNERFLSGVLTGGGLTEPAFAGGYDGSGATLEARPDGTPPGAIVIGNGATSTAAASLQASAGGTILLFAPQIDNRGGILRAPDGQVILAAGSKAYLALNDDGNDITLRGFRVEVEAPAGGTGVNIGSLVRNAGDIAADRGNVTLAALSVNQEGRISAKTAVQSNGSIFLQARTKDSAQAGSVNLAAGSVTEVVADADDPTTVADAQDYAPYRGVITATGRTISSAGTLRATGGRITLTAADALDPGSARIYLGAGSQTSVAGAWADVDFEKNFQTFRVTSNELKNSPNQKTGLLRGAQVTVDLRQDSNILALDGYRGTVQRSVAEKAAGGGELQITSSGSVIQRSGATIDASGGGYRHAGGTATTSMLLGDDGRIYGIASAPEARNYTALLDRYESTDARWGQTISMANPLGAVGQYHEAYEQGRAGGMVSINSAAGLVLDGNLRGGVTVGAPQLASAPRGATLRIGEFIAGERTFAETQRIGTVTWRAQAADTLGLGFASTTALTPEQRDAVSLGAEQVFGRSSAAGSGVTETGFASVEVNSDGRIVVPADVRIASTVGGELTLRAPQLDIGGAVHLPSGSLTLRPVLPRGAPIEPGLATVAERVIVRSAASLSTTGVWLNNSSPDGTPVGDPLPIGRAPSGASAARRSIDGGQITIQIDDPFHQTILGRGAVLDVGSGAALSSGKRVTGGVGGRLSIANGAASQTSSDWLQADLRGFGVASGGDLSVSLARAVIGPDDANGTLPANTTRLGAGLFAERGFAIVGVSATDGIEVLPATAVNVQQRNLVVDASAGTALTTGGDLAGVASPQLLPDAQRAPSTLRLSARGGGTPGTATLRVGAGASIVADPRGEVSLTANDALVVDGRVIVPGGRIGLTLNGAAELSTPALRLGATAELSTAGVFVAATNDRDRVQGTLYNGGSIGIDARNTGVRIDAGARVDVSAVNQAVDVTTSGRAPAETQRTLDGHAGSVTIKAQGPVALDGSLLGQGSSAAAAGGSFALELRQPDGQVQQPEARRIVVTESGAAPLPVAGAVDAVVRPAVLRAAGFEKLRLQAEDRIEFQGASTLAFERGVRLDAPVLDIADGSRIALSGSTVSIGQSLGARLPAGGGDVPTWVIVEGSAAPVVATRPGDGLLLVQAGLVDLYGSFTINGAATTRIESTGDIRFVGRPTTIESSTGGVPSTRQIGSMNSAGSFELVGAQTYPATRTEFSISSRNRPDDTPAAGGYILIGDSGGTRGQVYSAGGTVRLDAQSIIQAGTLAAPLGRIELDAGRQLELSPRSLTSVSADGLAIPFGTTQSGVTWRYVDGGVTPSAIVGAVSDGGKRIDLRAPSIDVRPGAVVDLRGNGDVQAAEFVPGNGGDSDITLRDNTFAVIPTANLATTPFDAHTQAQKDSGAGFALANGRDATLYDSIDIGPGSALPAGQYTLLPARYALLPNAFVVELNTASTYRNLQPGQTEALANGEVVVAGFRTARDTSVRDSQSIGVVVRPGSAVLRSSDFNLNGAAFFADAAALERRAAPRAPWDAGRLSIRDATALSLAGSFETTASASAAGIAGRGAEIDITGNRIAVVTRAGSADFGADVLQITGASISAVNGSVLLGGTRSDTDAGIRISTTATEVVVANDAAGAVRVPELTLTASERIDIRSGSVLEAGAANSTAAAAEVVIATEAAGALVRLSNAAQARVDRGTASNVSGDIVIAEGATLRSGRALLVDATRSAESRGELRAGGADGAGGSLSLASVQVNLGETQNPAAPLAGLVLSNTDLAEFGGLDTLILRGYGSIDLLGAAAVGASTLGALTLDTPLLRGVGVGGATATATIAARSIELRNSGSDTAVAGGGAGRLEVRGDRIVVGAGDKAVSGFDQVRLDGASAVDLSGRGALRAAAALAVDAPQLVALGGSVQTIAAVDDSVAGAPQWRALTVSGAAAAPPEAARGELGGRVTLEGRAVDVATTVRARSGQLTLRAHGSSADDAIVIDRGAVLDVSGELKDFNGTRIGADGGTVQLVADRGSVLLRPGATVDVSAAERGGAGRLLVRALDAGFDGTLAGSAAAGERSGSASVDVASLGNFSRLNGALNAGGFAESRSLRVRDGDLRVAAADVVGARQVVLAADRGRIDVDGTIGAVTAPGAARIELHARDGIALESGSRVLARGTGAAARGGEVRVATSGGALDFDRDAQIDVRAGAGGAAGAVTFGVTRGSDDTIGARRLDGTVLRGGGDALASVDLEATHRYDAGAQVDAADIDRWAADHRAFVAANPNSAAAGGMRDEAGALQGARLLGATELRRSGDLSIDAAWDLTSADWLAGGRPGTLTIRAGGNLTVRQAIGNGDDGVRAGATWNLRLAAGADLSGANPLSTGARPASTATQGALVLAGSDSRLRTGTGRIDLAAAGDVRLEGVAAAIYTTGRIGVADEANQDFERYDRWARDGGGISIAAGGSFVGAENAEGDLWVNEWLRRPRQPNTQFEALQPTDWWSHRPRFQQGVGTLGGGNIDVAVDGSISNLAAMAPTSGRTWRDAAGARQVDVQGGGDLNVRAGGDVIGSAFLVGRGTGRVEAAGEIGRGRATQVYLMGVSGTTGDKTPEGASIDLVAGGAVALQSVNNPTAMFVPNKSSGDPASGPSFGNAGNVSTFFTYADNSRAGVYAKSGNLGYQAVLHPNWRSFAGSSAINATHTDIPGAFPSSLEFVAFDGDLIGPSRVDAVTTYPSPAAGVAILASGSLVNVGLHASDRDPAAVISTRNPALANGFSARQIDGRFGLRPQPVDARILERESPAAFVFELQALEGSYLSDGSATDLVLTAPSRLLAGLDIVGAALTLQNLAEGDLTVVRADHGDFRAPVAMEIRGPGQLLLQAGRDIDLGTATVAQASGGDAGGLVATGNSANPRIADPRSARITLVAGVTGSIDLGKMDAAYVEIIALNSESAQILGLYGQLGTETDRNRVLEADNVAALAALDPAYADFVGLDSKAPRALSAYQQTMRGGTLPLEPGADSTAATQLYRELNAEPDVAKLAAAGSVAALAAQPGGEKWLPYVGLDERYPLVFSDYVQRRSEGALPTGLTPIVFSNALTEVVAQVVPEAAVAAAAAPARRTGQGQPHAVGAEQTVAPAGNINSFRTSIQTYGGSDIDLWAPHGDIVVGLTSPSTEKTVGVLTNAGGAIRSVLSGDFNINQGKVITAQGGDILILSMQASIDAGRGAKTSLATPPPVRRPILDADGNQIGVQIVIPASATGSGIQSLTSDPDGLGPLATPAPGSVYLFAPAGTIDAGEAGIRSSGNILLNAQTVLNASNISASGSSAGVPQVQVGSLAAALASAGNSPASTSKAAEDAAKSAAETARRDAASATARPNILSVEVLGFGDKNCKETDRDCFAK